MLGIENRPPFFQPFRQKGIQALWQFYYPLLTILAKTITRLEVTSTVLNQPLAIAVEYSAAKLQFPQRATAIWKSTEQHKN